MNYIIIGCGITGAVIARELAEKGNSVVIYDRRSHIAGNLYDYIDEHGYLVQQYGPHIFHTSDDEVINYVKKYETWRPFKLVCGATWDNKYTNTPFNFSTIDIFFSESKAKQIKEKLKAAYPKEKTVTVVELLNHEDSVIKEFADFLFKNDYAPYTAKQWGMDPSEVDPSILKRVPIILSYDKGYFSDSFEAMPTHSYSTFVQNILNHKNIDVILNVEAMHHLSVADNHLYWDNKLLRDKVIFTGAIDELLNGIYGQLPYRSLRFEWKYENVDSYQNAPVVAYPKEKGFTRITEYKKLPPQTGSGTSFSVEYPIPYVEGERMEPYYPVVTEKSLLIYEKYKAIIDDINGLTVCGRLGNFKYYNMDQAIKNALNVANQLLITTRGLSYE